MVEQITELLKERNYIKIKSMVKDMYPADIAAILEELPPRDITILFRLLPKELAADTFTFMNSDNQMHLISGFSDKELREMLDDIFVDDTVDIIEEMPANVVARILKNTDTETRKQINTILNYPDDSAGSVMTTEYVYLHKAMTVREALERIRKVGFVKETIYTCYVTENRKLIGIVTILDLVTADPTYDGLNIGILDYQQTAVTPAAGSTITNLLLKDLYTKANELKYQFYYNCPMDSSSRININPRALTTDLSSKTEKLSSARIWYDYNNINNKFVISEIDADYLDKGIQIDWSSKR